MSSSRPDDGDLSPEEFWEVMPEEDKKALSVLIKPEFERPFVNKTSKAEKKAATEGRKAERAEQKGRAEEAGEGSQAKRRPSVKAARMTSMRWSFWSQCHRCKLWQCGTCTGCRCSMSLLEPTQTRF